MERWIGRTVILKKKKKNGYPKGRNIGESLTICDIEISRCSAVFTIKGNRGKNDKFRLDSSYVMDVAEYREKIINEILTDE
jgi:hypothetical protein